MTARQPQVRVRSKGVHKIIIEIDLAPVAAPRKTAAERSAIAKKAVATRRRRAAERAAS